MRPAGYRYEIEKNIQMLKKHSKQSNDTYFGWFIPCLSHLFGQIGNLAVYSGSD